MFSRASLQRGGFLGGGGIAAPAAAAPWSSEESAHLFTGTAQQFLELQFLRDFANVCSLLLFGDGGHLHEYALCFDWQVPGGQCSLAASHRRTATVYLERCPSLPISKSTSLVGFCGSVLSTCYTSNQKMISQGKGAKHKESQSWPSWL